MGGTAQRKVAALRMSDYSVQSDRVFGEVGKLY
jgi:hypothetical protein